MMETPIDNVVKSEECVTENDCVKPQDSEADLIVGRLAISLQNFVKKAYSTDHWNTIKEENQLENDFEYHLDYTMELFTKIFKFTSYFLDIEETDLAENMGNTYYSVIKEHNSLQLLSGKVGRNLIEYIDVLSSVSDIEFGSFPNIMINQKLKNDHICIKYKSFHPMLYAQILIGFIKTVSAEQFNTKIEINLESVENKKSHKIFIRLSGTCFDKKKFEKLNKTQSQLSNTDSRQLPASSIIELNKDTSNLKRCNSIDYDDKSKITSSIRICDFLSHFPCHFFLNSDMELIFMGKFIKSLISRMKNVDITTEIKENLKFEEIFCCLRPNIKNVTFRKLVEMQNKSLILIPKITSKKVNLTIEIKGTIYVTKVNMKECVVFVGSQKLACIDDLKKCNVKLSEISKFDERRQFIFSYVQYFSNQKNKLNVEKSYADLTSITKRITNERHVRNNLLYNVIPPDIADRLKRQESVVPVLYENVTVMFTGIENFKKYCEVLPPIQLTKLLNDLSVLYDIVLRKHKNVFKIETAGDKYMLVSGLPNKSKTHAIDVINCAIEMMEVSKLVTVNSVPITATFGINSGEIVAGVIGQKLPRYCVFGSTVNIASRTETTGINGEINFTESVHKQIVNDLPKLKHIAVSCRGEVKMKGVSNPVKTYTVKKLSKYNNNNQINKYGKGKFELNKKIKLKEAGDSELVVETPIPHEIKNFLILRSSFTIEEIEEKIQESLKRFKTKALFRSNHSVYVPSHHVENFHHEI